MSTVHGEQVRVLEEHVGEVGRGINWWGMMFFISSEALIFANLIAAYLYLEIRNNNGLTAGALDVHRWVLPTGGGLSWIYPLINTVILIASSGPVIWARAGIAQGKQRQLILGLSATIIMGLVFLGGQVYEYTGLIRDGFTITYQTFGSAFFLLTGFHGLHVTIGVLFLVICLIRAIRGDFTDKKHFTVEAGEMYWHFVDIVWVVVFSTVYLLPLLLH
jgi:heme/copper-type cytochrome/quinol oxidase subunit 3